MIQAYAASLSFLAWRGLVAIVRVVWTLVRPGLRFVSAVLTLAAIVALTIDVTRWQTKAPGPTFQSLDDHIRSTAPATLDGIGEAISGAIHPLMWDPLLTSALALPAWFTLLVLGLLIGYTARERRQVNIFIN